MHHSLTATHSPLGDTFSRQTDSRVFFYSNKKTFTGFMGRVKIPGEGRIQVFSHFFGPDISAHSSFGGTSSRHIPLNGLNTAVRTSVLQCKMLGMTQGFRSVSFSHNVPRFLFQNSPDTMARNISAQPSVMFIISVEKNAWQIVVVVFHLRSLRLFFRGNL